MVKADLVMTDNAVVKIGNVECSVRAELEVDRAEPRVSCDQKVGLFLSSNTPPVSQQRVTVDPAGHDVAGVQTAAVLGRKLLGVVLSQPADRG